MRALLILDAALFALAGTLAVVLGVVLILFSFHTELSTTVATDMSSVAVVTTIFTVLTLFLGVAFISLLRRKAWTWWAQAGAAMSLVIGSLLLYRVLTA